MDYTNFQFLQFFVIDCKDWDCKVVCSLFSFCIYFLNGFAFAKDYQSVRAPSYHCEINLGVSLNVIFGYADKAIVKGYFF